MGESAEDERPRIEHEDGSRPVSNRQETEP
jgi:hypothetical protein